jgi:hypothetical protein
MAITFKEKEVVPDFPKAATILIDGREVGEIKPSLSGDKLSWYASIKIEIPNRNLPHFFDTHLCHGHGPSMRNAIADAIVDARRYSALLAQGLLDLERSLGTTGKSEAELEKLDL